MRAVLLDAAADLAAVGLPAAVAEDMDWADGPDMTGLVVRDHTGRALEVQRFECRTYRERIDVTSFGHAAQAFVTGPARTDLELTVRGPVPIDLMEDLTVEQPVGGGVLRTRMHVASVGLHLVADGICEWEVRGFSTEPLTWVAVEKPVAVRRLPAGRAVDLEEAP